MHRQVGAGCRAALELPRHCKPHPAAGAYLSWEQPLTRMARTL